jgi:ABC-type transporter Mla subunit MlaD
MAAVSVLEALLLIGAGIAGALMYRRVMQLVTDLEARQIVPLREKLDAILVDVKAVTARVNQQSERVDHAIAGTIDRVDETAGRVRESVREKVNQAAGVVAGLRAIIVSMLNREHRAA